jgi:glyoxylase-like metal-dependent hydrolase (beta-lactamase superfamily II)
MLTSDFLRSGSGFYKDSWRSTGSAARFALGLASLAVLAWPVIASGVGRLYVLREVKPQVFVWLPEDIIEQEGDPDYSRAGNAGFILTSEGVVAVDATNSPYHAREVLYEIRQKSGQPVRYLIDTGGSGDEVLGNEVFADLQVPILSTPAIQTEIRDWAHTIGQKLIGNGRFERRFRGIHVTPPNQIFQGETNVSLGGQTIRLIPFDPSLHAAAVFLPDSGVVFLGDLFQNQYFPRLESRDVRRWIDALRQVESWNADVYVPGHGDPGSKKEVGEFRSFLEGLMNEVQMRIAAGKSLEQVKSEVTLQNYPWRAHELAAGLVEGVYEQLSEPAKNNAASR